MIFFSFRLESPIHAPKISVFGIFYPLSLDANHSDPQKTLPCAERRVLSAHGSRSDPQGWTENAGPENAGPQKQDRKMEDKLPKAIT